MKKAILAITTLILAVTPIGWEVLGLMFSNGFLAGLMWTAILYGLIIGVCNSFELNKKQSKELVCKHCYRRGTVTRSFQQYTGSRGGRYSKVECSNCGSNYRAYES